MRVHRGNGDLGSLDYLRNPPQDLVVAGLYRHVRNPMYVSVLVLVLGQILLFGDVRLLTYGAVPGMALHLLVVFYEEPTLQREFGAEAFNRCLTVMDSIEAVVIAVE